MNKKVIIKWMVLPLAFAAVACTDYQSSIDELSQRVDGIDQRVTALEGLNDDIEAIKEIVDAQKQAGYITAVTETADGCQFTMSNGKVINVRNGRDGRDGTNGTNGQDGHTPVIGVTQDTDGNWYWTVDGEFLLDGSGNKVRANGIDGKFAGEETPCDAFRSGVEVCGRGDVVHVEVSERVELRVGGGVVLLEQLGAEQLGEFADVLVRDEFVCGQSFECVQVEVVIPVGHPSGDVVFPDGVDPAESGHPVGVVHECDGG